jgi:hypothetical protein
VTCGGDRIELYFDESGRGVSRLEGFDNVRFNPQGASGAGARAGATAAVSPTSPTRSATC